MKISRILYTTIGFNICIYLAQSPIIYIQLFLVYYQLLLIEYIERSDE